MAAHRHSQPKAYARAAGKDLGKKIAIIKQDLPEELLTELRTLYFLVVNYNDSDSLYKMVTKLNHNRYKTRSSFQVLSCYSKEHGHNTLEIREDRF